MSWLHILLSLWCPLALWTAASCGPCTDWDTAGEHRGRGERGIVWKVVDGAAEGKFNWGREMWKAKEWTSEIRIWLKKMCTTIGYIKHSVISSNAPDHMDITNDRYVHTYVCTAHKVLYMNAEQKQKWSPLLSSFITSNWIAHKSIHALIHFIRQTHTHTVHTYVKTEQLIDMQSCCIIYYNCYIISQQLHYTTIQTPVSPHVWLFWMRFLCRNLLCWLFAIYPWLCPQGPRGKAPHLPHLVCHSDPHSSLVWGQAHLMWPGHGAHYINREGGERWSEGGKGESRENNGRRVASENALHLCSNWII